MKLVILAGGKGTRMGPATQHLPKPMVPIGGKPILEHQVELARRHGLSRIHMLTGYRGDAIADYFGSGSRWGVKINYHREAAPLGTAGAVRAIRSELDGDFVVFYGDVVMDVDLDALRTVHDASKPLATLAVHPNDHPWDSDLVELDAADRVTAFHSKPHEPGIVLRNLVSAALYVLSPRVLDFVPGAGQFDFGRDIFPALVRAGETVVGYRTREFLKDVGTVERLREVDGAIRSGRVARFNRQHPLGAVFLDRDGVLNPDPRPVTTPAAMAVYPGVPQAVAALNRSERLAVVVTNQPLVAKGFATEQDVEQVHAKLETLLGEGGAYVDRIYYCPHHPERGHAGERAEYKIECDCRKPRTGMIEQATAELNIDRADSFIVGDRSVDVLTGRNAGIATILVKTGFGGRDGAHSCDPDYTFRDLAEAVRFLTERYPGLATLCGRLADELPDATTVPRVVAIGGLSRSGKTTLAAALARALRQRGGSPVHLRLDHWIVPVDRRSAGDTVRERYRYEEIRGAVQGLLAGERIEFARYDPVARRPGGNRASAALDRGGILLVDGTVALDLPCVRDIAALRLYVEIPETVRRARFLDFYAEKGLLPDAALQLYEERLASESPIVSEGKKVAHHIVNMETLE